MGFPCTGCGACCLRVDRVQEFVAIYPEFIGKGGRCVNLQDDMRCAIYEDRPLLCRVDRLFESTGGPHPQIATMIRPFAKENNREAFYHSTASACRTLQNIHFKNRAEEEMGRVTREACTEAARMGGRDPFDGSICPNCGAGLREQACKLLCDTPGCGYRVTCSEF